MNPSANCKMSLSGALTLAVLWLADSYWFSFPGMGSLGLHLFRWWMGSGQGALLCTVFWNQPGRSRKPHPSVVLTSPVCSSHTVVARCYLMASLTMVVSVWPFSSPFWYEFERVALDSVSLLRVETASSPSAEFTHPPMWPSAIFTLVLFALQDDSSGVSGPFCSQMC